MTIPRTWEGGGSPSAHSSPSSPRDSVGRCLYLPAHAETDGGPRPLSLLIGWQVYNLVGIPLAAGALLPSHGISLDPSVAAGLMAGSSLAVVTNSLLLRTHFGSASKQK